MQAVSAPRFKLSYMGNKLAQMPGFPISGTGADWTAGQKFLDDVANAVMPTMSDDLLRWIDWATCKASALDVKVTVDTSEARQLLQKLQDDITKARGAAPCDECGDTGFYQGFQVKEPCSKGCKP